MTHLPILLSSSPRFPTLPGLIKLTSDPRTRELRFYDDQVSDLIKYVDTSDDGEDDESEESVAGESEGSNGDDSAADDGEGGDESDYDASLFDPDKKRRCDVCKHMLPAHETTLHAQINGWVCVDKMACEARSVPPPRRQGKTNCASVHLTSKFGRR